MQYTISQLQKCLWQKVKTVQEIFNGFFGKEHVDLQIPYFDIIEYLKGQGITGVKPEGSSEELYEISDECLKILQIGLSSLFANIYVWWPKVTVTNEYDKSIDIQDLYAKIKINIDGRIPYESIGFLLNRATYTVDQFLSNYMHSHIQYIPRSCFSTFMPPCLGRGPIRNTILSLKNDFDEVTWMLFCQELSMYVTVESIAGAPWNRLENVGTKVKDRRYSRFDFKDADIALFVKFFPLDTLKDFIKYYLQNGHLSIGYREGKYVCGMPYYEYILDISNSFIEYYNKYLAKEPFDKYFASDLLIKDFVIEGQFYRIDGSHNCNLNIYRNKFVLNFKSKAIYTSIINDNSDDTKPAILLNNVVAMFILRNILRTINYKYRNEYFNKFIYSEDTSSTPEKRVIYI